MKSLFALGEYRRTAPGVKYEEHVLQRRFPASDAAAAGFIPPRFLPCYRGNRTAAKRQLPGAEMPGGEALPPGHVPVLGTRGTGAKDVGALDPAHVDPCGHDRSAAFQNCSAADAMVFQLFR